MTYNIVQLGDNMREFCSWYAKEIKSFIATEGGKTCRAIRNTWCYTKRKDIIPPCGQLALRH